jgi:hypothetical protein
MNLSPYLEGVRTGVQNAAALADENTQQVAYKLGTAVESATRLALISALSDAAGVISAELAPSSVELRMSGDDPEFVVTVSSPSSEPALLLPGAGSGEGVPADLGGEPDEDEPLSRISLRLPASVKARVDEQATKDGISTNAWLVRAVMDALADRRAGAMWPEPPPPPPPPPAGAFFGPGGPFGPHGVFGPGGAFGLGGVFGGGKAARHHVPYAEDDDRPRGDRPVRDPEHGRSGGSVQGWAR